MRDTLLIKIKYFTSINEVPTLIYSKWKIKSFDCILHWSKNLLWL